MSKTRDIHHTSLMVGRKATGKSTKLAAIARKYPKSKKVLIIDVNASPAYNEFREIQVKDIPRVVSGVVRLIGTPDEETLTKIARDFRDGLLIFEDCTKYISGHPSREIKTFLVDHRMYKCDLIFTFHSIKFIPPFFWQMTSYVMLCKTQEQLDTPRNRQVIPNYDVMLKAFKEVEANKDQYYSKTVSTEAF